MSAELKKVFKLSYAALVSIKGEECSMHCEKTILATDVEDAIRRVRAASEHSVRRFYDVRFIAEIQPDRLDPEKSEKANTRD